jgi:hypothetical protein
MKSIVWCHPSTGKPMVKSCRSFGASGMSALRIPWAHAHGYSMSPFRAFRTRLTMNSARLLSGRARQLANCLQNAGFSSENELTGRDTSKLLVLHITQPSFHGCPRSMNGIHQPKASPSDGAECKTPLRLMGWNCHALSIVASCCAAAE